jgi:enoyl-CoA hydratase/carnithine racemase
MANLEYTYEDGVATVLLNRPERKNAFTLEMLDDCVAAFEDAKRNPEVRVIVLRGAGDSFCAGVDLDRYASDFGQSPLEQKELLQFVQRVPHVIDSITKPLIASMSGPAVGGGFDLALMCDIRLAARSVRVRENYIRLGVFPGFGGLYFVTRLAGTANAAEMFLTGDWYDAEECMRLGLVNRVYDDDVVLEKTYELAAKIARAASAASQMMKSALYQSSRCDLRTALDLASSHLAVIRSADLSQAGGGDERRSG